MILPTLISSTSLVTLFFASKALAGVYVTNPVNETVLQAGQNINIQWGKPFPKVQLTRL